MPGAVIGGFANPENASVFDPYWLRVARRVAKAVGMADPQSQVMGIAAGVDVPGDVGGLVGMIKEKFPKLAEHIIQAYHGSPAPVEQIEARPMFLAETPKHAAAYRAGPSGTIAPYNVRMNNPKTVTSELLGSPYHENLEIQQAIAEGHDGIIWKSPRHPETSYIAFNPPAQVTPGLKAYHGSPHDFEQFSLEKIGTGEGAQAYGHGLYFAEKEGTAKSYRDILAQQHWNDRNTGEALFDTLAEHGTISGKVPVGPNATLVSKDDLANGFVSGQYNIFDFTPSVQKKVADRLPKGKMYEVAIKAHPDQFLDWDKPLSQQSESVKEALKKVGITPPQITIEDKGESYRAGSRYILKDVMGRAVGATNTLDLAHESAQQLSDIGGPDLYRLVGSLTTGEPARVPNIWSDAPVAHQSISAAERLKQAGIPGIKYLDQGSRASSGGELIGVEKTAEGWKSKIRVPARGDSGTMFTWSMPLPTEQEARDWAEQKIQGGSRNYVVFDDKTVEILKKYGLLPPVAGAALKGTDAEQSR